jgi:hypothetical protein
MTQIYVIGPQYVKRLNLLQEELCQIIIPVVPSGIELATFHLVAQCLNQLNVYFFVFIIGLL